ncbi:recombinase family protein, partial [Fusobacterium necrophorum]
FIDEEKAIIVREIYRLYLEGMPSSKIAAMYDFEPRQIRRMLSNPVYAGKLKYHQVRVENKKKIESKEYEVFDGIH